MKIESLQRELIMDNEFEAQRIIQEYSQEEYKIRFNVDFSYVYTAIFGISRAKKYMIRFRLLAPKSKQVQNQD